MTAPRTNDYGRAAHSKTIDRHEVSGMGGSVLTLWPFPAVKDKRREYGFSLQARDAQNTVRLRLDGLRALAGSVDPKARGDLYSVPTVNGELQVRPGGRNAVLEVSRSGFSVTLTLGQSGLDKLREILSKWTAKRKVKPQ